MDKAVLLDQIDFVQARIEDVDKKVINCEADEKRYQFLLEAYNKWVDRYNELMDKLEEIDDENKVDIEMEKIQVEKLKIASQKEIEQSKINLDAEKLNLDREKFYHEVRMEKRKEPIDIIFRSADLGVKVLVPVLGITATMAVAGLAYVNDAELKLCNGRIFAQAREVLKVVRI